MSRSVTVVSKIVFVLFFIISSIQDLREQKITKRSFIVFFICSIGSCIFRESLFELKEFGIKAGILFIMYFICRSGQLGAGDVVFFFLTGMLLSLREELILIITGITTAGILALGMVTMSRLCGWKIRKTIPFIPCMLPGLFFILR